MPDRRGLPGRPGWSTVLVATGQTATDHTQAWAVGTWGGAVFMGSGNGSGRLTVRHPNGSVAMLWPHGVTQAARVIQTRVAGDYLYASFAPATGNPRTVVFRLAHAGSRVTGTPTATLPGAAVLSPAGPSAGGPAALGPGAVTYRGAGGELDVFDPDALPATRTLHLSAAALGQVLVTSCWLPGRGACVTYRSDGTLVVAGPASSDPAIFTTKTIPAQGIRGPLIESGRRRLGVIALGPDISGRRHVLAATSFFSPSLIDVDPRFPDRPAVLGVDCAGEPRQVESLAATASGVLAIGTYPGGAQLSRWDPARPTSCAAGPQPQFTLGYRSRPGPSQHDGRHRRRQGGRRDLWRSQLADGWLCIYDMSAGLIEPTRVSIAGQGVSAIATRPAATTGGCVYVGTNADPPDNGPAPDSSRLVRYHLVTHEVQYLPLPGRSIVSGMAFGADDCSTSAAGATWPSSIRRRRTGAAAALRPPSPR